MQLSELDWAYVQERAAHFTGRGWVFARLDQFLNGPPGVFLLLGAPGTGKTAVAAQLALAAAGRLTLAAAEAAPRRAVPVAAAYFCRAGRVDLLDVAQRLSDQIAEAVPGFADARRATLLREIHVGDVQVHTGDIAAGGLVTGVYIDLGRLQPEAAFVQAVTLPLKRVREAGENTQVIILVDALDEGLASQAAKELPRLLGDVEYVHLVVTARPDHRAIDWLRERAERVDLLADSPPGSDDVLEYCQRRLLPVGVPAAMEILAQRIAELASGNFLYAFYVIETLRRADVLASLDAAAARGLPLPEGGLPGVYRDFLRRELWRDDRAWSRRFRPVLAPLAVAQDEGFTTEQLRLVAGRLGKEPMTRTAVREVTRTAGQFLSGGDDPDGPFLIYHRSFADFLVNPEENPGFLIDVAETHEAIVAAYAATDPLSWDSYARRNLALHAREAGQLDRLLEDARVLLAADPARWLPHLYAALSVPARAAAAVYRQNAHLAGLDRPMRASQLELTAHQLGYGDLAVRIAGAAPDRPWQTRWSHRRQGTVQQVLTGHGGPVRAVTAGKLTDGTPIIVSGSDDTVRVWRLEDGAPVCKPLTGGLGVRALAAGKLQDGTPIIVSAGDDGTVRVWQLPEGAPVGEPLRGHASPVNSVAAGRLKDDGQAVAGVSRDGTVSVWQLSGGVPVGEPLTGHLAGAVAAGTLADGTLVIVTVGDRPVWRLKDDALAVAGVSDVATVRICWLADRSPAGEPRRARTRVAKAVRTTKVGRLTDADGTPVVVGFNEDGTMRVWKLEDGTPLGQEVSQARHSPMVPVEAVAAGELADGTLVLAVGGDDGMVRVCRLADGTPAGQPLPGHTGPVNAVAAWRLPDATLVIVTGGNDGTVRVWRLADGTPAGQPLRGPAAPVRSVAFDKLHDGTPVVVSGSGSAMQRWRLADGTPAGQPPDGRTRVARPKPTPNVPRTWSRPPGAALVTGNNGMVRLVSGNSTLALLRGRRYSWVSAAAVGRLADGAPVVVIGGGDGTVGVWRLTDGTPTGQPLRDPTDPSDSVAVNELLDGTLAIVIGGDGPARVWRLAGDTPAGELPRRHTGSVNAVAAGRLPDGTPVILTGGNDSTVQVWRLADTPRPLAVLHLPQQVMAVAVRGDLIVTAAGADIALHQLALPSPNTPTAPPAGETIT